MAQTIFAHVNLADIGVALIVIAQINFAHLSLLK